MSSLTTAQTMRFSDENLTQIHFDQKLDAQVSPALSFYDEEDKPVRLSDYFGTKPILLVLGYYKCPMLCTLVLNGMVESAADLQWSIGREFEVVSVSINPGETSGLAAEKKRAYVKRYGRAGSAKGWHFLIGHEESIHELAREVGFHYAYDPASKEYAHPSGLIFLTPEGKVCNYLFGVTFSPRDLFAGLQIASARRIGSPIQQLVLLCFHYNPITGKYSGIVVVFLRLFAAATMLGLCVLIIALFRRGEAAKAELARDVSHSWSTSAPVNAAGAMPGGGDIEPIPKQPEVHQSSP
jgi:protein SCO1/2